MSNCLVTGLLLLLAVERVEADGRDLDDLEADTGKVTDGVAGATETGHEDLVVLLDVVEGTVTGHEGDDLLAVLDQLHADALADGGVRLLGLDTDLLKHDTLAVGGPTEGVGLDGGEGVGLLPGLVGPPPLAADADQLARGAKTVGLGHTETQ